MLLMNHKIVQQNTAKLLLSQSSLFISYITNIFCNFQGFEWNKYNQTHYDIDNPPPKIVQGYKFNVSSLLYG